jgi:hypothetical protein
LFVEAAVVVQVLPLEVILVMVAATAELEMVVAALALLDILGRAVIQPQVAGLMGQQVLAVVVVVEDLIVTAVEVVV